MEDSLKGEVWKDIPGYDNRYQVSSCGRVRRKAYTDTDCLGITRTHKMRYLKGQRISHLEVKLVFKGVAVSTSISRLVYENFIGKIPVNKRVYLIDRDKPPSVSNLYLDTTVRHTFDISDVSGFDTFYRGSVVHKIHRERRGKYNHVVTYMVINCVECGKLVSVKYRKDKADIPYYCFDCGYKRAKNVRRGKLIVGDIFRGNLVVNIQGSLYEFKCPNCGRLYKKTYKLLRIAKYPDCGCSRIKKYKGVFINSKNLPKLYNKWRGMKKRCSSVCDKKCIDYYYNKKSAYNGEGIRVCKFWKDSFYEFARWSLDNNYDENNSGLFSIDRIYSDGDYAPFNCQFLSVGDNSRKVSVFDSLNEEEYVTRKLDYEKRKSLWIKQMIKQGYKEEDLL